MTNTDDFRRLARHIQPGMWARTPPDPLRRYPSEGLRYGVLLEVWPVHMDEFYAGKGPYHHSPPHEYPFLKFQDMELPHIELIHVGTLEFEMAGMWLSAFDLLALEAYEL